MLKLKKKYCFWASLFLLGLIFLVANLKPLSAASVKVSQVKLLNSPVIYFLHYETHHKKAYLNATSYLSYGHKWSDAKIISAKELATWADFKLIRTGSSPAIYYVEGNKRAKLLNRDDLESFGFLGEPILNVSEADLNQYKLVSYEAIGLTKSASSENSANSANSSNDANNSASSNPANNSGNLNSTSTPKTNPAASFGSLLVFNDLTTVAENSLVTNTVNNLMGTFRFKASGNVATVTALILSFTGLYNDALLSNASAKDDKNVAYRINTNVRASERQITINFRDPLTINPGEEKTVKVYVDFKTCDCNNQSIRLELKQASDIQTNLKPIAAWPLQAPIFKIVVVNNLLGSLTINEESIVGVAANSNSGRLLGKFKISEVSGKEDVLIKRIVFDNTGSAGKNDLINFSLSNNNQVIARVAALNSDRDIAFDINYLRISKGAAVTLTVSAALQTDYNKEGTIDLRVVSLTSSGLTHSLSLPQSINNLTEIFTLN